MFSEVFRKALNNFSDETEGVFASDDVIAFEGLEGVPFESCLMKTNQFSCTSMMG